jgi:hypothetical protein
MRGGGDPSEKNGREFRFTRARADTAITINSSSTSTSSSQDKMIFLKGGKRNGKV